MTKYEAKANIVRIQSPTEYILDIVSNVDILKKRASISYILIYIYVAAHKKNKIHKRNVKWAVQIIRLW